MSNWNEAPFAGEKWFRPAQTVKMKYLLHSPVLYSKHLKAETRHVIDRTLGADVIFVSGRYTSHAPRHTCTLEEWNNWAVNAKQVK